MNNQALRANSQPNFQNEKNTEFERYSSLINIFKGFEEYTLDPNGVIISSNLEAVNITGYEEWEVIGRKMSIFYSAEDQLTGKPNEDLLKSEKRGSIVFTGLWMKKRSSYFLAKIKISAIKEDGILMGYKMILQDATYKAVSNHKIKKIRDEYLNLFNNSFVGIVKFNMHDFTVFMINDKGEKMIASENERSKLKFDQIFESPEDFSTLTRKLLDTKKVEDFQFQLKGTKTWLMTSLRYFSCEEFAEGILIDITEMRRKESEIARLNHELDQLIYHASHELRAPLSTILGIINLMKLEKGNNSPTDYTNYLEQNVNRLDSLLKKIVAITYNNKIEPCYETVDWKKLVDGCLKETNLKNEKIQVVSEVKQSADFRNDSGRIKIIINNVLANSIKYFNPNETEPRVKVEIITNEAEARITISDNGVGIDQKYLKKIFDMFYKAHTYDGTGLGLYIVKVMVDKLGGTINVESKVGAGTILNIVVPNINS